MHIPHQDIDSLLAKHFANEHLSADEQAILTEWQERHSQEYAKLQHLLSTQRQSYFEVDTKAAWQRVLARKQANSKPKRFSLQKTYLAIAAAASLLLIISLWSWLQSSHTYIIYKNETALAQSYTLPDQSVISLNANSHVRYNKKLSKQRAIELLAGEVYFEVAPDKNKPFIIHTTHTNIRVVGTAFNVKMNADSTEVSVSSGIVELIQGADSLQLLKGERAVAQKQVIQKSQCQSHNYAAWKTHQLVFKNTDLTIVCQDLERYFDCTIQLDKNCSKQQITNTFRQESLAEVLQELQLIAPITYEIHNKEVSIFCNE